MSKAWLVLVAISLAIANHVSSAPSPFPVFELEFCRNAEFGNYTTNSTYQHNLATALSTLQEHASSAMFYNTSAGNGTNTVHAQYYCRGDIDSTLCSNCVVEATLHALNCSNAKGGIIWYEQCTLRYKNESMYGVSEERPILTSRLLSNITNPKEFSSVLNDTMNNLIQQAVNGNGSSLGQYFATGENTLSGLTTAYFLVQCSPDLTKKQCESCLRFALNKTRTCCGEWPKMLYTFPPTCQVMYDTTGIFYFDPNAPPSSPLSPSAPPTSSPSSSSSPTPPPSPGTLQTPTAPGTGGSTMIRSRESIKLGIITIAIVYFVLVFNR